MQKREVKRILDTYYQAFNHQDFIQDDPISIPSRFARKEDIEIMGFLVALISWGQRTSIIRSGERLISIFNGQPYEFITSHSEKDLKACLGFVHRTLNDTDLLSLISFLKYLYREQGGLEAAFSKHLLKDDITTGNALEGFRKMYDESQAFVSRTARHIAYPSGGSACKRLNMFLRWMVRKDAAGVDFGIWTSIRASQLVCPLDIHVLNQAHALGLIKEKKGNWKTALELTEKLRSFDPEDPVKYDFALFGKGIAEKTSALKGVLKPGKAK